MGENDFPSNQIYQKWDAPKYLKFVIFFNLMLYLNHENMRIFMV